MTDTTQPPQGEPAEKAPYKPVPPAEHQFKPGQSGNPAGKKPGTLNRKTIFGRLLDAAASQKIADEQAKVLGEELRPLNIAEQIGVAMIMKAINGDQQAADWVYNNAMDKMADKTETTDMTLKSVLESVRDQPAALPKMAASGAGEKQGECQPTMKPLTMPPLSKS